MISIFKEMDTVNFAPQSSINVREHKIDWDAATRHMGADDRPFLEIRAKVICRVAYSAEKDAVLATFHTQKGGKAMMEEAYMLSPEETATFTSKTTN